MHASFLNHFWVKQLFFKRGAKRYCTEALQKKA